MFRRRRLTLLFYALLIAVSVSIFWPLSGDNDRYAAGIEAADRGEFKKAFTAWKPLAERGYPRAQYGIAVLLEQGKGIARDPAEAARWYRKAAEHGVWEAQVNLGLLLIAGDGVTQDYAMAASWFQKAADLGSVEGQTNLAQLYRHGLGVEQDSGKAADWLLRAARQGYGVAQYTLATLYQAGEGVASDPVEAYFWSSLAASAKQPTARQAGGLVQRLTEELSAEQLIQLQHRLAEWKPPPSADLPKR